MEEIFLSTEDYRTSEHISLHEATKAIAIRAAQIELGDSYIYTDYKGLDDSVRIAIKEFLDGKNPLLLHRRTVFHKKVYIEVWKVRDMVIPVDLRDYDVYSYQKYI